MSSLRKQMEADMAVRGLAYRTRETYVQSVAKLAKFYSRRPDQISETEVQRYLLHLLQERKLAHSSCNVMVSALEFFYRVTLHRREIEFCLPRPKVPAKLPQILAREEVAALIETTSNLMHRALLIRGKREFGAGSQVIVVRADDDVLGRLPGQQARDVVNRLFQARQIHGKLHVEIRKRKRTGFHILVDAFFDFREAAVFRRQPFFRGRGLHLHEENAGILRAAGGSEFLEFVGGAGVRREVID